FGSLLVAVLLPSPLPAVLGGGGVGAIPALLAAQLRGGFPHARAGDVSPGAVGPCLRLAGSASASGSACGRGEHAGRGGVERARCRGGVVIASSALLAVVLIFLVAAPIAVRANTASGMHGVLPSPSGRAAFVDEANGGWGGGWVVEVPSGKRLIFVPPPIHN